MSSLLKSAITRPAPLGFLYESKPFLVNYREHQPALITFSNGRSIDAACLRCPTTPCANFSQDEIDGAALPGFPSDLTASTCAAEAISIEPTNGYPTIDAERCLACGICAIRCPVGAITIRDDVGARVSTNTDANYVEESPRFPDIHKRALEDLSTSFKIGVIATESDALLDRAEIAMDKAINSKRDHFPVHHTRNLLIASGQGASMRRKGNNHMRMDILLSEPGASSGLVEVEFGMNTAIESPRDVLDAAAVLNARYGRKLEEMTLLIAKDVLPNERSVYWDVIADISKVLSLKIGTITTTALQLSILLRRPLGDLSKFYVDRSNNSYRANVLEVLIGRKLKISDKKRSLIESVK